MIELINLIAQLTFVAINITAYTIGGFKCLALVWGAIICVSLSIAIRECKNKEKK